jgi:hypothetical protein
VRQFFSLDSGVTVAGFDIWVLNGATLVDPDAVTFWLRAGVIGSEAGPNGGSRIHVVVLPVGSRRKVSGPSTSRPSTEGGARCRRPPLGSRLASQARRRPVAVKVRPADTVRPSGTWDSTPGPRRRSPSSATATTSPTVVLMPTSAPRTRTEGPQCRITDNFTWDEATTTSTGLSNRGPEANASSTPSHRWSACARYRQPPVWSTAPTGRLPSTPRSGVAFSQHARRGRGLPCLGTDGSRGRRSSPPATCYDRAIDEAARRYGAVATVPYRSRAAARLAGRPSSCATGSTRPSRRKVVS